MNLRCTLGSNQANDYFPIPESKRNGEWKLNKITECLDV